MLANLKARFDNFSMRKKIAVTLLVVSVFPMVILQLVNFLINVDSLSSHVDEIGDASLIQTHSEIDARLQSYQDMLATLSSDRTLLGLLRDLDSWSTHHEVAARDAREKLQQTVFGRTDIFGIALVADNGNVVFYDALTESVLQSESFSLAGLRQSDLVRTAMALPEWVQVQVGEVKSTERHQVVYFAKSVSDYNDSNTTPIGTLILCVDQETFAGAYQKPDEGVLDATFVVDGNDMIFSSNNETLLGQQLAEGETLLAQVTATLEGLSLGEAATLSVKSYADAQSPYRVVNVQQQNYLYNQIYSSSMWMLVITAISILSAVLLIDYISHNIDRVMKRILGAMQRANSGDLSVHIENDGKDEFAQISQGFNHMIREMRHLLHREKTALDDRRKAEIRALEAQINPHFLYNTLDSINWMAIEKEQFEISKALKYLAVILRYSIANSTAPVTVEEELSYLRKYIYLQQNRYQYSFLCRIDAPEEVQQIHIHKLLMQPLLENSIEHGFAKRSGEDCITIKLRLLSCHRLSIEVSDNGVGMPEAMMKAINQGCFEQDNVPQKKGGTSIGIQNVSSRVRIYYGAESVFHVSRNGDHGTKITIIIPYEQDVEEGTV